MKNLFILYQVYTLIIKLPKHHLSGLHIHRLLLTSPPYSTHWKTYANHALECTQQIIRTATAISKNSIIGQGQWLMIQSPN